MKVYQRLAMACLTLAALLSIAHIVWTAVHNDMAPAMLPPAGEAIQASAPYTFAVMGDNRVNTSVFESILTGAQRDGARFIIHTGDLVGRGTKNQFEWLLGELQEVNLSVPFCAVPGNHDLTMGPNRRLVYERAFGPRQYWFSYGDALFVAFDDSDGKCSPEDLQWLDSTLARLRPQYGLCFVFTHIPPRDPRPNGAHDLSEDAANALMAVLTKHTVTALFAGHIHTYLEDTVDGIPVYISGGAGATRDEPIVPYHYLLCTVNGKGSYQVRKVDVPDVTNTDYAEYVYWVKYPVEKSLAVSVLFLLAGMAFVWRSFRPAR